MQFPYIPLWRHCLFANGECHNDGKPNFAMADVTATTTTELLSGPGSRFLCDSIAEFNVVEGFDESTLSKHWRAG